MEKKVQRNFLWIALLVLGTIWILARHNQVTPYQTDNGLIFGTVYKVTYQCDQNLKAEIEAELKRFDGSLSPFNDTATILYQRLPPKHGNLPRDRWCLRYHRCPSGQCLGIWFQEG